MERYGGGRSFVCGDNGSWVRLRLKRGFGSDEVKEERDPIEHRDRPVQGLTSSM